MKFKDVVNKFQLREYMQYINLNDINSVSGTLLGDHFQAAFYVDPTGSACECVEPTINGKDFTVNFAENKTGLLIIG